MTKIYVVGKTKPNEVYIASKDREFLLDEYLIVKDIRHENPIGEVVETFCYPTITSQTFPFETCIFESLTNLGFIDSSATSNLIYFAKLKILKELPSPIMSGSEVGYPALDLVKKILMPTPIEKGLTLGVVQGTKELKTSLPIEYQNIAPLFSQSEGIIPQIGIPFILDHYSFREYPHIGLFGGSGSGKTVGIRVICEELMKNGVPAVLLDPHYELSFNKNLDESNHISFANKHEIFQVGENIGINFTELNTDELISLIEFIGDLTPPMVGALQELHENKDSFTSLFSRVDKLRKAFEFYEKPDKNNKEKLPDDVVLLFQKHRNKISGAATLQAVSWRLDQLDKIGLFKNDVSLVEKCIQKRKIAVIRGKQKHLKMISSYLINKLYRKRRLYRDWEQTKHVFKNDEQPQKFPPFFIIIDEAHEFAPKDKKETPIKRVLREISQEARKYGVFEIFGTQRPALLDTTITAQLNTKIIFRTNIESDMQMIKTETNLNHAQMTRLPELSSGNAFVSSATLRKTMYIRFKAPITGSSHNKHPFDELENFNKESEIKEVLLNLMPIQTDMIPDINSKINQSLKRMVPVKEILETLEEMAFDNIIIKEKTPFGVKYI